MPVFQEFIQPARGGAQSRGRFVSSGGTNYYTVPGTPGFVSATTRALTTNRVFYEPWMIPTAITIDQIAVEVTTNVAVSTVALALYNATASGQPDTLVADFGTIDSSTTGVKTVDLGAPLALAPGRYLAAIVSAATTVTMRSYRAPCLFLEVGLGSNGLINTMQTAATWVGAFVNPGTAWTNLNTGGTPFEFMVFARVSVP